MRNGIIDFQITFFFPKTRAKIRCVCPFPSGIPTQQQLKLRYQTQMPAWGGTQSLSATPTNTTATACNGKKHDSNLLIVFFNARKIKKQNIFMG